MSVSLMAAVFELPLPAQRKLILLALADNANDEGRCWPSQETIARKASISVRNLRDHLHGLEADGWLAVLSVGNGRGKASEYLLATARLKPEKADPAALKADAGDTKGGSYHPPNHQEPSSFQPPRKKEVDEAFKETLRARYPHLDVDAELEAAMNHTASKKAINMNVYANNWLRKADAWSKEKGNGRTAPRNVGNQGHPSALQRLREAGRVVG